MFPQNVFQIRTPIDYRVNKNFLNAKMKKNDRRLVAVDRGLVSVRSTGVRTI